MVVPALVFSDLDGTLLDHQKRLLPENVAAVRKLAELGGSFVPCSGRAVTGIPADILGLPSVRFAVCANGAVINELTPEGPRVLHTVLMSREKVLELFERFSCFDITFDVFLDGQAYAEAERYRNLERFIPDPANAAMFRSTRKQVDMTIPELLEEHPWVEKIVCFWRTQEERAQMIAMIDADPDLVWSTSASGNIEINDVNATKGTGLKWLCEHVGVPVSEAVAFGDDLNDVPMIEAAGDGVAMGNAKPEVLAVADHVTLDCDHAGVGAYLMQLLDV